MADALPAVTIFSGGSTAKLGSTGATEVAKRVLLSAEARGAEYRPEVFRASTNLAGVVVLNAPAYSLQLSGTTTTTGPSNQTYGFPIG